jgi:hypothetical protein
MLAIVSLLVRRMEYSLTCRIVQLLDFITYLSLSFNRYARRDCGMVFLHVFDRFFDGFLCVFCGTGFVGRRKKERGLFYVRPRFPRSTRITADCQAGHHFIID